MSLQCITLNTGVLYQILSDKSTKNGQKGLFGLAGVIGWGFGVDEKKSGAGFFCPALD